MAENRTVVDAAAAMWSGDEISLTVADGVTRICNGDPLRRSVTVFTDPSSVGTLRLVANRGQRTGGIRIVPGAGFDFRHAGEVYGYAVGGDVIVSVVSETGAVC